MIKNKVLNIKFILKTCLKILKIILCCKIRTNTMQIKVVEMKYILL